MAGKYGFAYGIAKGLGIDTTGMTVGEVFEAINDAEGTKGGKVKNPYERPDEKETERESDETKKPKKKTSDGFGGEHEATDAEKKRLVDLGIEDAKATLSKRDWARIYQKLWEIKRGGFCLKTYNGEKIIILHKMSDNDIPKVAIIKGNYDAPVLKNVIVFNSDDNIFDEMEMLKWL